MLGNWAPWQLGSYSLCQTTQGNQKKLEIADNCDSLFPRETILRRILCLFQQWIFPETKCWHILFLNIYFHPLGKHRERKYKYHGCTFLGDIVDVKQIL